MKKSSKIAKEIKYLLNRHWMYGLDAIGTCVSSNLNAMDGIEQRLAKLVFHYWVFSGFRYKEITLVFHGRKEKRSFPFGRKSKQFSYLN